jgi:peptidoglycan hydrolase CwlO-like protein
MARKTLASVMASLAIAAACLHTGSSALAEPTSAEISNRIDEENGNLDSILGEISGAEQDIEENKSELDILKSEISRLSIEIYDEEQKLADARARLSSSMRAGYKDGTGTGSIPIGSLLSASSVNSMISLSYYNGKVMDAFADEIAEISDAADRLKGLQEDARAKSEEYSRLIEEGEQGLSKARAAAAESEARLSELEQQYEDTKRAEEARSALAAAMSAYNRVSYSTRTVTVHTDNGSIARAAASLALTAQDVAPGTHNPDAKGRDRGSCLDAPDFDEYGTYYSIYNQLRYSVPYSSGGDPNTHWASCDRAVATAVKWSGADDDFPWYSVDAFEYMQDHPEKWMEVGIYSDYDTSWLQPGDILSNYVPGSIDHILIYVGSEAAQEKFPGTQCLFYSASHSNPEYSCSFAGLHLQESRYYHVFRYIGNYDGALQYLQP